MAILSQSEVDALVQSLVQQGEEGGELENADTGEAQKNRVLRVYDFRSPDKFAREHIRILYMLHDDFARLSTLSLSANLRTPVSVSVNSVEQSDYEEFLTKVEEPTVISIFSLSPLRGKSIMEFDPRLALMIIDRLFGGLGKSSGSHRALTEIEKATLKTLFSGLMEDLAAAWKGTIELSPLVDLVDSNAFHAQFLSSKEVTAIINFTISMKGFEAGMRLCLPYYSLEPVLPKLSASHWISRGSREDTSEKVPEDLAQQIPVNVQADLGAANLTLKELMHLEAGDVVVLGKACQSPVDITIQGKTKFTGLPGRRGRKFALRVVEKANKAGVGRG